MGDRRTRQRRLDRAWVLACFEFVVAVTVVLLAVFAAPGYMGGGPSYPSQGWWLQVVVLPAIEIGGIVVGFVWMSLIAAQLREVRTRVRRGSCQPQTHSGDSSA